MDLRRGRLESTPGLATSKFYLALSNFNSKFLSPKLNTSGTLQIQPLQLNFQSYGNCITFDSDKLYIFVFDYIFDFIS